MDEKHPQQPQKQQQQQQARSMTPLVRRRPLLAACLIIWSLMAYGCYWGWTQPHVVDILPLQPAGDYLVSLEAHIMSKCPDARDCLEQLILPAMEQVADLVNFTLSFIGTPTEHNDGVACMHGPAECLGNIIELCAQKLYPDPKTFLGFTMCMSKDYPQIPQRSLIEDCALEHAIDFEALNKCASDDLDGTGASLLRDSVKRSAEAGVTMSCTVRLDEKIYCIRDDGEWKSCPTGAGVDTLVDEVKKLRSGSV